MKLRHMLAAGIAGVSVVAISVAAPAHVSAPTAVAAKDARARAEAIVARMTLDEKIALVHGLFPPFAAGKTQKALDAEREARKAAELKAKQNEDMYKAALAAARDALKARNLKLAETKFNEAKVIFKTDAVEVGLREVKAARDADAAALQKADEEKRRAREIQALIEEGRRALDAKKFDEAKRTFQKAKKLAPENLDVLAGLPNLESLNLYGTQVTNDGVAKLAGLPKLKKLYLWQTKVDQAGIDALKAKLPECEVVMGL